jgi:RNA polymerase sigma-70 factor, ECF subfamily
MQDPKKLDTFDRLYEHHAPRVMAFLLRLTANQRADAEDLTQDTFIAAFKGQSRFQRGRATLPWLLGIAYRRWRDANRTQKSRMTMTKWEDELSPTVHGHAESVTEQIVLAAALDKLPEKEREVLLLTAVQGLTYKEAAEVLGEPVGTVKWRMHEATKKLRCLLGDDVCEPKATIPKAVKIETKTGEKL